jgi:hypothetical protein
MSDEESPKLAPSQWHITKDVPVIWLMGSVAAVVLSFAQTYSSGQRVIEKMTEMSITLNTLSAQANKKDLKDIEHDLRINDLDRRMLAIEQRKDARPNRD